jgi:hypothetical protein
MHLCHDDVMTSRWHCNVSRNMRLLTTNSYLQSEVQSEVHKLSYRHLCHDVKPWHFKSVIASWRQKISWHNFGGPVPTPLAMWKTNFKNVASTVLEEMSTVRFFQNVETSRRHSVMTSTQGRFLKIPSTTMSTNNLEQKYSKMTKLESKEVRQLNFVEE